MSRNSNRQLAEQLKLWFSWVTTVGRISGTKGFPKKKVYEDIRK